MKGKLIFILLLLSSTATFTQIITVKQDSTGDFTTIQAAVDNAQNGDTVLVWPGTYYENLVIDYKSIILGSLTLTTGDNLYLRQTIIDGNKINSCLKVEYCDTFEINGFSIKNGYNHSASLKHGGGILFLSTKNSTLNNCVLSHNSTNKYGGGICFYRSNGFLSNVTITNNHAYDRGGGILLLKGTLTFDTLNRCNIYENYAAVGADFYKLGSPDTVHFAVDTFTVQNPDYYYAFSTNNLYETPEDDITFNILHHKIEQDSTDLYVAPWGNNANSGLTPDQPLKTISYALLKAASDSITPDTIHLANGTYSISSGEMFPLSLKSFVTIQGESRDSTILDVQNSNFHLNGIPSSRRFCIKSLTLMNGNGNIYDSPRQIGSIKLKINNNINLDNLRFSNNTGNLVSSLKINRSNNCSLNNVEFINNLGGKAFRIGGPEMDTIYVNNCKFIRDDMNYSGGGISTIGQGPNSPILLTTLITNTLFAKNRTGYYSGYSSNAVSVLYGSKIYLVNCTLSDNYSENPDGGNIGVIDNAQMDIYNSILYNDTPAEIYMFNTNEYITNYLNIYHSLVDGGEQNIQIPTGNNVLHYDTTNIDTDPLFYGGPDFPYNLSDESPCIDAGTLDLPQFILDHMPDVDLAGNPRIFNGKIDMGAYEWNPTVGTGEHRISNTEHRTPNLKVFPNPFSTTTYIAAQWKESSIVNIEVYNNAGLLVKTLQSGKQLPGSCQIPWNGTDNTGNYLPTGVYVVVLRIDGKEVESVKVVRE